VRLKGELVARTPRFAGSGGGSGPGQWTRRGAGGSLVYVSGFALVVSARTLLALTVTESGYYPGSVHTPVSQLEENSGRGGEGMRRREQYTFHPVPKSKFTLSQSRSLSVLNTSVLRRTCTHQVFVERLLRATCPCENWGTARGPN
jgi:hypothetical protein